MIKCRLRVDGSSAFIDGTVKKTKGLEDLIFQFEQQDAVPFLQRLVKDANRGKPTKIGILTRKTNVRIGTFEAMTGSIERNKIAFYLTSAIKWEGGK